MKADCNGNVTMKTWHKNLTYDMIVLAVAPAVDMDVDKDQGRDF